MSVQSKVLLDRQDCVYILIFEQLSWLCTGVTGNMWWSAALELSSGNTLNKLKYNNFSGTACVAWLSQLVCKRPIVPRKTLWGGPYKTQCRTHADVKQNVIGGRAACIKTMSFQTPVFVFKQSGQNCCVHINWNFKMNSIPIDEARAASSIRVSL